MVSSLYLWVAALTIVMGPKPVISSVVDWAVKKTDHRLTPLEKPHVTPIVSANDEKDAGLVLASSPPPRQSSYPWLEAVNEFNSQYSIPVVVVVGLAGNLLALAVFLCSPLRRITSSVYLACQAVTDLLFLTFLGINWLASIQVNVFSLPGLCHAFVSVTFVVSFLSLWVVVALTFDLYTSIQWRCVHRRISRPSRALAITVGLMVVGCATYSFSFWLTTKSISPDNQQVVCHHNDHASLAITGAAIDSALTLVLPFFLLIFMNTRILHVVLALTKRRPSSSRGKTRHRRRSTSGTYRRRGSVARLQDHSYHRLRQARRRSQQVIISSLNSSSEGHVRKQVSFENERRISLVFEENGIKYDEESGEITVVAKVVVMNDETAMRRDKAASFGPVSGLPMNGERRSFDKVTSRRHSANYPIRRFSASTPLRIPSPLQSTVIEETLSKSLNSTGHLSISRPEQESKGSKISNDDNDKGTMPNKRTVSNQNSLYPRHYQKMRPRLRKVRRNKRKVSALTRLQYRCFRMVLSVSVVFLCLNVPSHTIRLQSLVRSLIDSDYRPTQFEYHLQQFLQFFYYLNFVLNVFIYSACAKNFRTACFKIHWHLAGTVRQLCGKFFKSKQARSEICLEDFKGERENSRHVEICLKDIQLSKIEAPREKPISPPCLIHFEGQQNRGKPQKTCAN